MLRRGFASLVTMFVVAPLVLVSAGSSVGAETIQPAIPLLVSVTAQDLGGFDRVTFTFVGTQRPEILLAEYQLGTAFYRPRGEPVEPPIPGVANLVVVMSGASGVDLFQNPPFVTYTGPQRFAADLPNVTELVQLGDFEATLTWAIGVNDSSVASTVVVRSGPTRVEVDIPHGTQAIPGHPSFTG